MLSSKLEFFENAPLCSDFTLGLNLIKSGFGYSQQIYLEKEQG